MNSNSSTTQFDSNVLRGSLGAGHQIFDALAKRKAVLAGAIGALILAGISASVVVNRHEAQAEAGKSALFLAQRAYETELKALSGAKMGGTQPAAKSAKDGKDAAKTAQDEEAAAARRMEELSFSKFDVDAKFPQTVQKYRAVIDQYSGTRAAYEARMGLGNLYFAHGEAAKAATVLQGAVDAAPGSFEKALALSALGYAHENGGKPNEAVQVFEKALNLGEGGIKGDLLLAIARCQAALHDSAKARSTYDRIISELPNTEVAKVAESLKARL